MFSGKQKVPARITYCPLSLCQERRQISMELTIFTVLFAGGSFVILLLNYIHTLYGKSSNKSEQIQKLMRNLRLQSGLRFFVSIFLYFCVRVLLIHLHSKKFTLCVLLEAKGHSQCPTAHIIVHSVSDVNNFVTKKLKKDIKNSIF